MIEIGSTAPIPARTTILIELDSDIEVAGEVVWREKDRAGIRFHERIATNRMMHLLRSKRTPDAAKASVSDGFGRPRPSLLARALVTHAGLDKTFSTRSTKGAAQLSAFFGRSASLQS
jgi:hypothetical protein